MRSDLIDVAVQKHAETAKICGEQFYEITLPEWLAKDKGLI